MKNLILITFVMSLSFIGFSHADNLTKLTPNDAAEDDAFGVSVANSNDYAIIGAHTDDDNGSNSGSAYIFKRSGDTWIQQNKITANDGAESEII